MVVIARTRVSNAPLGEPFRVLTAEAAEKVRALLPHVLLCLRSALRQQEIQALFKILREKVERVITKKTKISDENPRYYDVNWTEDGLVMANYC